MPSRAEAFVALALLASPCFAASPWTVLLTSAGYLPAESSKILIAPPAAPISTAWRAKVESGAALILCGASPLAESFGFKPRAENLSVIHIVDEHNPTLPIIWSAAVDLPRFDIPEQAHVFAKDRWSHAPLIVGVHIGRGAVLWTATDPGPNGYERFPYLIQALSDLGFEPPIRAQNLWAFFDYSYRLRADPDYLAARWRSAGFAALHVASWHFFDPDPDRDAYLTKLIEACHRHGILVYAWVEFPHVSEKFWTAHPAWREQTGLLQDAQLDWRKLMNLENRECAKAAQAGLEAMIRRFDWDGVNLAELYFESLEGISNPARFTPMNNDVRREFESQSGWDPIEIWTKHDDAKSRRQFLDFRAELARRMQEKWLAVVEGFRAFRPDLDVVLTHVDDRFDTGMKDAIGADAGRVLPLLDSHSFSFLVEDPATIWNLGPQRYAEIAKRYRALTPHTGKLGIDINIVERYQDVYPTKQQTGGELFELVHLASAAFPRVALYSEDSILKPDLPLLPASSAVINSLAHDGARTTIDAANDLEIAWPGRENHAGATVDGKPWPLVSDGFLRLPAGKHTIESAPECNAIAVTDLNARLIGAAVDSDHRVTFEYDSQSRAIVRFARKPRELEVDAAPLAPSCNESRTATSECAVLLPRGRHTVSAR